MSGITNHIELLCQSDEPDAIVFLRLLSYFPSQCQFAVPTSNIKSFVKDGMEIPNEEENFFRVSKLVYNEIPAQLRSFFKHKWQSKFSQDWDDSPTSGDTLWKTLSPGTRSKKWNDEIKNKIKEGSSHAWDCTVLFEVLLYLGMTIISISVY